MNVESVTVEPLDLALREPFETALGTQEAAENVLVRVETDDGVVGVGEASPYAPVTGETQASTLETCRAATRLVEGRDLRNYRAIGSTLRDSFAGASSSWFAIETALLDAYCRERGMPLSELFGGAPREVETDLTVGICPPDVARERAGRAVDEGFSTLKVKVGTDVPADVARTVAVAEAAPDARLAVDANQGWTEKEAARFVEATEAEGVALSLLEQPVPADDVAGLQRTTRRVSVPVAADESLSSPADAVRLAERGAADVFNVKLAKSGLLGAAEIATVARAANVDLMVGCMEESAVGIHTSAHLVAGLGGFGHVDLDGNQLLAEDVVERERGPTIDLSGPGHGVET